MTAYDVRARATAARNLRPIAQGGKGQAVAIHIPGVPVRDPATGKTDPGTPIDQTGSGIETAYKASEINGLAILQGDKRFMLSPLAVDGSLLVQPTVGSIVTLTDQDTQVSLDLRVIDTEPLSPAGHVIFTWLQLRK